jgi:hypothetical protein
LNDVGVGSAASAGDVGASGIIAKAVGPLVAAPPPLTAPQTMHAASAAAMLARTSCALKGVLMNEAKSPTAILASSY